MINDDNDNGNNDYDTMMIIISHKDNGVGTRRNHLLSVPGNVQWIVLFYGVSSWWSGGLAKKAVTDPKGHAEIWNMIYPDHWSGRSIFQKFHGRHTSDSDTSNVSKFGQILQALGSSNLPVVGAVSTDCLRSILVCSEPRCSSLLVLSPFLSGPWLLCFRLFLSPCLFCPSSAVFVSPPFRGLALCHGRCVDRKADRRKTWALFFDGV